MKIIPVDDGSSDQTWIILRELTGSIPSPKPIRNTGAHGFRRAIITGLDIINGKAVVIRMSDKSNYLRDVVRYWNLLNEGGERVLGSSFIAGGGVINYPRFKLLFNLRVNSLIRKLFRIKWNDTTNAFKAYRAQVIDGYRPFLSPYFHLTVEIPLKAIIRGNSWTVTPIT
jgi:dolichol-phosphate mannosyltransferase